MELYNELRENWERLYWDEGYSKKIARDHANYESAEEDDEDFNPYRFFFWPLLIRQFHGVYLYWWVWFTFHYRNRRTFNDPTKVKKKVLILFCWFLVFLTFDDSSDILMWQQEQGFVNRTTQQGDDGNWDKVNQIRDKFEYDRERRMREKGEFYLYINKYLFCIHAWTNVELYSIWYVTKFLSSSWSMLLLHISLMLGYIISGEVA